MPPARTRAAGRTATVALGAVGPPTGGQTVTPPACALLCLRDAGGTTPTVSRTSACPGRSRNQAGSSANTPAIASYLRGDDG